VFSADGTTDAALLWLLAVALGATALDAGSGLAIAGEVTAAT